MNISDDQSKMSVTYSDTLNLLTPPLTPISRLNNEKLAINSQSQQKKPTRVFQIQQLPLQRRALTYECGNDILYANNQYIENQSASINQKLPSTITSQSQHQASFSGLQLQKLPCKNRTSLYDIENKISPVSYQYNGNQAVPVQFDPNLPLTVTS